MFRLITIAAIAIWAFYSAHADAQTVDASPKANSSYYSNPVGDTWCNGATEQIVATCATAAIKSAFPVDQTCTFDRGAVSSTVPLLVRYNLGGKTTTGVTCSGGFNVRGVEGVCPSGYNLSADGQTCTSTTETCADKAGQVAGSGLYDIGTKSTDSPDASACNNGCMVSFSGTSPAYTQIIDGKTHYYAQGEYTYVDFECSAGTLPSSVSTLPAPTCGTGQAMGTVNGKTVCVNVSDGKIANTNDPVQQSTTNKTTTTNPDGSKTETITKYYSDGSSSSAATTTNPDGSSSTVTTVTPSATGDKPPTDETPDICSTNPNIPACKDPDAGQAVATNGLYSAPSDRKTFDTVFSNFKASVEQAPFYAAATGFFQVNIPAGTCSGLNNTSEVYGTAWTVDPGSVLCSSDAEPFYNLLSIGLMLAAVWVAYRIAFL